MLTREKSSLEQRFSSLNDKYNKMEIDLNDKLQKLMDTSRVEKDNLIKKL